ncbi:hypothetical protein FI667_g2387, partial [Globisporangium splendens]
MNSVGAPSQAKRPPEKGSFPLDHYGECKPFMKVLCAYSMNDFLACMKEHRGSHIDCKHLSKAYLECRMDKGLMQEEELDHLGFHEEGMRKIRNKTFEGKKEDAIADTAVVLLLWIWLTQLTEEGFVAGLGVKAPRYK